MLLFQVHLGCKITKCCFSGSFVETRTTWHRQSLQRRGWQFVDTHSKVKRLIKDYENVTLYKFNLNIPLPIIPKLKK